MLDFLQSVPFSFAALFPVVNPLGSAMIFLTLTAGASAPTLHKLAFKVAINTMILLVVILLTGTWILRFFGIDIPVVQIGGGLVVAYIGWTLLNKPVNGANTIKINSDKEAHDMAFFPLTMPITAGPGAIAVTLTIGAHEMSSAAPDNFLSEIGAIIGIFLVSVVVLLSFYYARRLTRKLGPAGTQVIMRLAAFINLCIGIEIIWRGIQGLIL